MEKLKNVMFTELAEAEEIFESEDFEVVEIDEDGAIIVDINDEDDQEIEVIFQKALDTFTIVETNILF